MTRAQTLGIMAAELAISAESYRVNEFGEDVPLPLEEWAVPIVARADALLREAERVSPEPCDHSWYDASNIDGQPEWRCLKCGSA